MLNIPFHYKTFGNKEIILNKREERLFQLKSCMPFYSILKCSYVIVESLFTNTDEFEKKNLNLKGETLRALS